jgi:trk system potassium uptake protein TrkA
VFFLRTIIIGAGKVGFSIAQMLSQEEHDVVVIDRMGDRLDTVAEHLDVQVVSGNGASLSVLKEAGAENAELLAAVTEIDELNIVSCIVARSLGVKRTIARVRNPEYVDLDRMTHKEALGIDLIINPERVTAMAIARLAANAEAENAEFFAEGKIQLLELEIKPEMKAAGTILQDLKCPYSFLIVAILRGGRVVIPRGKDKLKLGDKIYILAQTHEMREVEKIFGQRHQEVANVAILGGGRGGFYLAQQLENDHVHVKIIEKDITRCRFLAEQLNHSLVIHGDGADLQLLEDENIGATDLFVALTGDDKLNLLVSLLAKHLGAKKTIAQIRRSDYNPLITAKCSFLITLTFPVTVIKKSPKGAASSMVITENPSIIASMALMGSTSVTITRAPKPFARMATPLPHQPYPATTTVFPATTKLVVRLIPSQTD